VEKETFHFAAKLRHGSIEGAAAWIDDDGPLRTQAGEVMAHGLADTAPDTVPHHGFAHRPRHGKPDMRSIGLGAAEAKGGKQRAGDAGTLVVNLSKFAGSQQTDTFRKTRDGYYLSSLTVSL
jgi:hypothetical protein